MCTTKISELNFKLRDYVAAEEYTRKLLDLDKKYDKDADIQISTLYEGKYEIQRCLRRIELRAC
jgi:hypothetical protein